jgi:hypothetical protein
VDHKRRAPRNRDGTNTRGPGQTGPDASLRLKPVALLCLSGLPAGRFAQRPGLGGRAPGGQGQEFGGCLGASDRGGKGASGLARRGSGNRASRQQAAAHRALGSGHCASSTGHMPASSTGIRAHRAPAKIERIEHRPSSTGNRALAIERTGLRQLRIRQSRQVV